MARWQVSTFLQNAAPDKLIAVQAAFGRLFFVEEINNDVNAFGGISKAS